MSRNIHNERTDRLLDGILSLQNREEAYRFFEDLCTVNELESLGQRFEVAGMLREDRTYQDIAQTTGASTATISRVNRCLNYGTDGYVMVLDRMSNENQRSGQSEETKPGLLSARRRCAAAECSLRTAEAR